MAGLQSLGRQRDRISGPLHSESHCRAVWRVQVHRIDEYRRGLQHKEDDRLG